MKANQSKGFQVLHKNSQRTRLYAHKRQASPSKSYFDPDLNFELVLKHLFQGVVKLFVVLKYLFYTLLWKPISSYKLPWLRIGFFSLVAFVLFKRDLQFSINMGQPSALLAKDEVRPNRDETWFAGWFPSFGTSRRPVDLNDPSNPFSPQPTDDPKVQETKEYISRYAKIAVAEMHKFGIPASVKMAQGMLESRNGESALAAKNNNHFGIKCFSKSCKKGHCSNFGDDHHKDFFRKYKSAWESWRAHSQMISEGRYSQLLEHGKNYKKWAKGLKKLGYATDKTYDIKLVDMIETYQLYLLDEL